MHHQPSQLLLQLSSSPPAKAWQQDVVQYGGDDLVSAGANFSITCVLSIFQPLKWTLNGLPVLPQQGWVPGKQ